MSEGRGIRLHPAKFFQGQVYLYVHGRIPHYCACRRLAGAENRTTTEDAEVRRERGELFFVHSSGCPVCVLCFSPLLFHVGSRQDPFDAHRLPQTLPGRTGRRERPATPCGTIHVTARQVERLRILRIFLRFASGQRKDGVRPCLAPRTTNVQRCFRRFLGGTGKAEAPKRVLCVPDGLAGGRLVGPGLTGAGIIPKRAQEKGPEKGARCIEPNHCEWMSGNEWRVTPAQLGERHFHWPV